jgi:hypothetical protein
MVRYRRCHDIFYPGKKGRGQGNRGDWNDILCYDNQGRPQWKALTIYKFGGYHYKTDKFKRVCEVKGTLIRDIQDRNTTQQKIVGKLVYGSGDQAGHIIGLRTNGGGEGINLIPMAALLNQGPWKKLENSWVKLLDDGSSVKIIIRIHYFGKSVRPSKINVEETIDRRKQKRRSFQNPKPI